MIINTNCTLCGEKFTGIRRNNSKHYFCSPECQRNYFKNINNPCWKGGRIINPNGRSLVLAPDHPRANENGYVYETIIIAEKALGKRLPPKALVHHMEEIINNKSLVICQNQSYHKLLHNRKKILDLGGNPNLDRYCFRCKSIKPKEEFGNRYCKNCRYEYYRGWKERKSQSV